MIVSLEAFFNKSVKIGRASISADLGGSSKYSRDFPWRPKWRKVSW